jgi:hypothetical protein
MERSRKIEREKRTDDNTTSPQGRPDWLRSNDSCRIPEHGQYGKRSQQQQVRPGSFPASRRAGRKTFWRRSNAWTKRRRSCFTRTDYRRRGQPWTNHRRVCIAWTHDGRRGIARAYHGRRTYDHHGCGSWSHHDHGRRSWARHGDGRRSRSHHNRRPLGIWRLNTQGKQ